MPFIIAIIFSLFLFCNTASAANLSIEIGKDSSSVAAGRDFRFGYGLVGISSRFTTDAPWSYVPTTESLNNLCRDFIGSPIDPAGNTKNCEQRGFFRDGDEWEVFGKLGFRLPIISRVYINTGMGVSKQKITELFIFCDKIGLTPAEISSGVINTKSCSKAEEFISWGQVKEHYYLNFLGGLTVEMTRQLFLNIDYHARNGLMSGLMWRF